MNKGAGKHTWAGIACIGTQVPPQHAQHTVRASSPSSVHTTSPEELQRPVSVKCTSGPSLSPARACVSAAVCESLDAPNCTANPPAVPCSRRGMWRTGAERSQ